MLSTVPRNRTYVSLGQKFLNLVWEDKYMVSQGEKYGQLHVFNP